MVRCHYTLPFSCPSCGGLIPGYTWWEKEVLEQSVMSWEVSCNCGRWAEIRDEMLGSFSTSRVEALEMFRQKARRLKLPIPRGQTYL